MRQGRGMSETSQLQGHSVNIRYRNTAQQDSTLTEHPNPIIRHIPRNKTLWRKGHTDILTLK
jgi:hypothetical protein